MKQQIKKRYRLRNKSPAILSVCTTCSLTAQLLRSLQETPVDVGLEAVWSAQKF